MLTEHNRSQSPGTNQARTNSTSHGESLEQIDIEVVTEKRRRPRGKRANAVGLGAEELPKLRVRTSEVEAEALVDTGSVKSFMRPRLLEVEALKVENA